MTMISYWGELEKPKCTMTVVVVSDDVVGVVVAVVRRYEIG